MKTLLASVRLSLTLIAVVSMGSVYLAAEDLPLRGPIPFSVYDVNNDGFVSESEFYETRAARMSEKASKGYPMRGAANAPDFSEFDTDGDGKLTKIELLEGQNRQMQKRRSNRGNMQQSM